MKSASRDADPVSWSRYQQLWGTLLNPLHDHGHQLLMESSLFLDLIFCLTFIKWMMVDQTLSSRLFFLLKSFQNWNRNSVRSHMQQHDIIKWIKKARGMWCTIRGNVEWWHWCHNWTKTRGLAFKAAHSRQWWRWPWVCRSGCRTTP